MVNFFPELKRILRDYRSGHYCGLHRYNGVGIAFLISIYIYFPEYFN